MTGASIFCIKYDVLSVLWSCGSQVDVESDEQGSMQ
jgi:hypothetical protein